MCSVQVLNGPEEIMRNARPAVETDKRTDTGWGREGAKDGVPL